MSNKPKLVRIDQDTRFDLPFRLRKMADSLEELRTIHGSALGLSVVVAVQLTSGNARTGLRSTIDLYHFGPGSIADTAYILERAKAQIL